MKKINLSILLFVVVTTLFFGNRSYAQLAGTFTIDPSQPPSATNFSSFTSFSAALDATGISSPVTVEVNGNATFNEVIKFNNITGSSATNTVRINGNGATVQFITTSGPNRNLLTLNNTSYLTIDHLNFEMLPTTTYGWAAQITGGSAYDSIINCTFDLSENSGITTSNNNGIVFTAGTSNPVTTGTSGNNCYIGNNHIIGSTIAAGPYYGIYVGGVAANVNNIIENNIVEKFNNMGIYIGGPTGTRILNNEIHRGGKTTSTAFTGIYISGNAYDLQVVGNRIHSASSTTKNGTFYGLYASSAVGTASQPILIANNAIYNANMGGTQPLTGIYLNATKYNLVYHNTIVLNQLFASGTGEMAGIVAYGITSNMSIKNNLINVTNGNMGVKFGFKATSAFTMDSLQMNNYYVSSTQAGNQYYAARSGTNFANAAALHASFPNSELGSPVVNPNFVNAAAGNFAVLAPQLIGAGINLTAYVPKDINGNIRPSSPTIGAFETVADIVDAATDTILSATPIVCEGPRMMSAVIRNNGNVNITSLKVNWSINGVAQPQISFNQTLVPANSPGNNTATVPLAIVDFPYNTPITVKAWTSNPNGIVDNNPLNDNFQHTYTASNRLPSAQGIMLTPGPNETYTIKVDMPQNVDTFFWDFGDGNSAVYTDNQDITKQYLTPGTYVVTVILRNSCGDDTLSTPPFTTLPVGIENEHLQSSLTMKIFPNPINELVQIRLLGLKIASGSLSITDLNGRVMKIIENIQTTMTINMKDFAPGIYLLKYTDTQNNIHMKLIKK